MKEKLIVKKAGADRKRSWKIVRMFLFYDRILTTSSVRMFCIFHLASMMKYSMSLGVCLIVIRFLSDSMVLFTSLHD